MQEIRDKRLRFERFTLDLARATLRVGDNEVTLRPKTLDVLRHLAENAGSLVLKKKLHEIVWANAAVTDDSLVQCIRELRQVLGDEAHSLIKTVSRRGYLLNAAPKTEASDDPAAAGAHPIIGRMASGTRWVMPRLTGAWQRSTLLVAVVLLCVGLGTLIPRAPTTEPPVPPFDAPARVPASALNKFFTERDAQHIGDIARAKQLPLPLIEFDTPDDDVPMAIRRFVGVWVSDKGFVHTNRQFMFVVTHVEKQGVAGGWTVRGPPAPNSRLRTPAAALPITAYISDGGLTYSNSQGDYRVWFTANGGLVFRQTYPNRDTTMVALDPVWTLLEAQRPAAVSMRIPMKPSVDSEQSRPPVPIKAD